MYINGERLKVRRYSSGELKLVKSKLNKYIVNNNVKILYLGEYSVFELLIILKYYKSLNVKVDLILGYLPYQRMDHRGKDELDTVNYVLDIFDELNLNSLVVCEPHCDLSGISVFSYINHIKDEVFEEIEFNIDEDIVVLTDKGGLKRYGDISKKCVYFNKVRDDESGLIVKHEIIGNVEVDKKVVIVDDIISTGDTIVNIVEELERKGVKSIYIMSGHFENNRYNKRLFDYNSVKKIYSTNSLKKKGNKKLKLFDIGEMFSTKFKH